jgi:hypothetical protein
MSTFIFLSIGGGSGTNIPVVANYNALIAAYPPPNTTHLGQFVFVENAQGTWWIPGPVLGTYYPAGLYYCNGTDWKTADVPYQATQVEVDAGTVTDKFVSPETFNNSTQLASKVPTTRTINGLDLSANRVLTASDVGAPSGSGSSTGTNTGDQTFLNARVQTVASSATVTATSTNDIVTITAQAEGLTLANPTGTFTEGQSLIFRIKDNGTARTIGYGANFRAIGVTAPTTTVANKTTYIGCIYNSTDTKFDMIGVCTEV